MTTKAKDAKDTPAKATPAKAAEASAPADEAPEPAPRARHTSKSTPPGVCVVNDGRCVGRAVNGLVCSYHAMNYRADGTRRNQ
jgi:hypothetical protein